MITSQPFAVEVTSGASGLVVRPAGELDIASVPRLTACLLGLDANVVIDMAAVTFIDSTGLSELVGAFWDAAEHGRSFVLRSPTALIAKVMQMTGADQVLAVEP
jgi:anti-sigma B factor antagonist